MTKNNIEFEFDAEGLRRFLEDEALKGMRENDFDVQCPSCGSAVTVSSGEGECPSCGIRFVVGDSTR